MTDYAMTLALRGHLFRVLTDDNYVLWSIVEVARDGKVLAVRYDDQPYCDRPGVALHRWFDGNVLAEQIDEFWERSWV